MDKYNCGIYIIENITNSKKYIGSSNNCERRWKDHKKLLRRNKHHSPYLQSSWNKYTEASFEFVKILICEPKDLIMYEQIFMDHFKSYDREFGYNVNPKAESCQGKKLSEERIVKMRMYRKGFHFQKNIKEKFQNLTKVRKYHRNGLRDKENHLPGINNLNKLKIIYRNR